MKIGFIGIGAMGQPMLANLLKHGHQIVAYDVVEPALAGAVKAGATRAASSAAAARDSELVVTILPSSSHVEAAYLGPGGVLEEVPSIHPGVHGNPLREDRRSRTGPLVCGVEGRRDGAVFSVARPVAPVKQLPGFRRCRCGGRPYDAGRRGEVP